MTDFRRSLESPRHAQCCRCVSRLALVYSSRSGPKPGLASSSLDFVDAVDVRRAISLVSLSCHSCARWAVRIRIRRRLQCAANLLRFSSGTSRPVEFETAHLVQQAGRVASGAVLVAAMTGRTLFKVTPWAGWSKNVCEINRSSRLRDSGWRLRRRLQYNLQLKILAEILVSYKKRG